METKVDIFLIVSTKTKGRIKKASYQYILACGGHSRTGGGELTDTTGNRLALTCAAEALLRMTKPSMITIHTDSRYLINGCRSLHDWKKNGWGRPGGGLKNADLWQQLDAAKKGHAIQWCFENMDIYK